MFNRALVSTALIGSLSLAGCENLPGNAKQQGAVIGGAGGAAIGAAVAKNNRLLGALIGGALGAGGGYLIGANKDKITGGDKDKTRDEAIQASQRAEQNPARAEDVNNTRTADLNNDGFVTLDEVVALRNANLSDREILDRLERTDQVFELTPWQEDYLQQRGVSRSVINEMRSLNRDAAGVQTASDRSTRSVPSDDRFNTTSSSSNVSSTSVNDSGDRFRRYDDRGDKNDLGRFDQDRFDNSGSVDRIH
jgi:hypothetical protein